MNQRMNFYRFTAVNSVPLAAGWGVLQKVSSLKMQKAASSDAASLNLAPLSRLERGRLGL